MEIQANPAVVPAEEWQRARDELLTAETVSYTHLTLPTIYSV